MGKMISLAFYRKYSKHPWLVTVNLISSHATLFRFILERRAKRAARFERKIVAPAA